MDEADVDCASCGYAIKDFSNVVTVSCGHGIMHYNCGYFNNECAVCESKLIADSEPMQFRPRAYHAEENLKAQLTEIVKSLGELKNLLEDQKLQQQKTTQVVEELSEQLKTKDDTILTLQKEIYEMKLEKVENLKKDLQEKLSHLG